MSSDEASPLDEAKIAVELASSSVAVERVRRELDAARYALASSWAGETATFVEVRADYSMVSDLPSENELLENIKLNPACRILEKKVALASASFDLAQAEAIADLINSTTEQAALNASRSLGIVFSSPSLTSILGFPSNCRF